MKRTRQHLVVAGWALGMVALGVGAPAFAEGGRISHMTGWRDGDASSNWHDRNSDDVSTRVIFYDCTREFRATIRRTLPHRPDPKVASEWINCRSYPDAVRGGDLKKGNYHFDVNGMGIAYCVPGGSSCIDNKTTVRKLRILW